MPLGPVQLLVVGFDRPDFSGEALAELERLRTSDVVRVLDLLVIHKDADGVVRRLHRSDLGGGDAEDAGGVVGALIGLGAADTEGARATRVEGGGDQFAAEEELWTLDEAIPNDSAAAIALIEHRWAIGTRDASGPLEALRSPMRGSIQPISSPPASRALRTQHQRAADASCLRVR